MLGLCEQLQAKLCKRVDASIFLYPVDPQRDECPDYLNLISNPMDLGSVAARLSEGGYEVGSGAGGHAWFSDVKLTFDNAMVYNPGTHPVHRQACKLQLAFADGYSALLVRTVATLRRFGNSERWRLACAAVLRDLATRPDAWPFLEPVDVEALQIPDYLRIVKTPMDLGTIGVALQRMEYESAEEVTAHVNLVFENAILYNPRGHPIHVQAAGLKRVASENWRAAAHLLAPLPIGTSRPYSL